MLHLLVDPAWRAFSRHVVEQWNRRGENEKAEPYSRGGVAGAGRCVPGGAGLRADEAADVFNSLYGDDYRKALASRDSNDGRALANKLYAAALSSKDQPALLAVLCEKTWELAGKDPAGLPIIMDSERLLATVSPAKRQELADKFIDALNRFYAAAKPALRNDVGEALIEAFQQQADARKADDPNAAEFLRKALTVATAIGSLSRRTSRTSSAS